MNTEWAQRGLTWWRGLQPRERLMVGGGGAVLALFLFYLLLWAPLQRDLARLRVEAPKAAEQLTWMRSQAGRINQLRAQAPTQLKGGGLLSFVEQSATAFNIKQNIKRVEPEGSNAVRLVVDGVSFNNLVSWLGNLHKQGGVRVDNATFEGQATPGIVNARLLLRAGT